jgi:hypothetical protein
VKTRFAQSLRFKSNLYRYSWALPSAAVYVPLMGVGFVWLAFSPMISIAQEPIMCFLPFMIVVTGFFGNVRYPVYGKVTFPIALMAIGFSTIFGWAGACKHSTDPIPYGFAGGTYTVADFYNGGAETCTGTDGNKAKAAWDTFAFKGDIFGGFGKGLSGLGEADLMGDWIAPALLFGMIGFLGTMTCVESAEAAGDKYPMAEIMIVDGIGTMLAALFGGMFGTTVYIGHPVHKALGAKIGYSILNGVMYLILLSTGMFATIYSPPPSPSPPPPSPPPPSPPPPDFTMASATVLLATRGRGKPLISERLDQVLVGKRGGLIHMINASTGASSLAGRSPSTLRATHEAASSLAGRSPPVASLRTKVRGQQRSC